MSSPSLLLDGGPEDWRPRGIHLVVGRQPPVESEPGWHRAGAFHVRADGPLARVRVDGALCLAFDGILTGEGSAESDPLEVVRRAWESGGLDGLRALEGFFNVLVVDADRGEGWLVPDRLATRPLWCYASSGRCVVAPSPTALRAHMPHTPLDPLRLYQTLRSTHPVGSGSLVRDLARTRPLSVVRVDVRGDLQERPDPVLRQRPAAGLTLPEAAERMRDVHGGILRTILDHPEVGSRPIELPLTGGLDSRHILADLLSQGRRPDRFVHVILDRADHRPVELMAERFGVPLTAPRIQDLDWASIVARWVHVTGGLVHPQQMYLIAWPPRSGPRATLGFDGYLAGFFLSFRRIWAPLRSRFYTPRRVLDGIIADARAHEEATRRLLDLEAARFEGPPGFLERMSEVLSRGPYHTGALFGMRGGDDQVFAPGAHVRVLELFRILSGDLAADKRVRLQMFRSFYPALAAIPDSSGRDLWGRPSGSALPGLVERARRAALPSERVPGSIHARIRRIPTLRRVHLRLAADCALEADGLVRRGAVRWLTRLHMIGVDLGWPLGGLLSAEVAHRIFARGEPPAQVTARLLGEDR
ncbi:MAG: hypothetical protein ACQEXJ_18850 [Myxococcota bacterium]